MAHARRPAGRRSRPRCAAIMAAVAHTHQAHANRNIGACAPNRPMQIAPLTLSAARATKNSTRGSPFQPSNVAHSKPATARKPPSNAAVAGSESSHSTPSKTGMRIAAVRIRTSSAEAGVVGSNSTLTPVSFNRLGPRSPDHGQVQPDHPSYRNVVAGPRNLQVLFRIPRGRNLAINNR